MRGMETDGQLAERISSAEQPSSSLHEHHRHHHSDEAGASSEREDGEIPAEDSPPHPHADYEPPLTDNPSITGGRGEALTNEPRSGKRPFER